MDYKTNLVLHISFSFFFLFIIHCLYSIVFLISFMDFLINKLYLVSCIERTLFRLHVNAELQRVHTISCSTAQGMQILEKDICQKILITSQQGIFYKGCNGAGMFDSIYLMTLRLL